MRVGQAVQAGQVIGNTGDSLPPYDGRRNPHLHLEIRKQGRAIATNPVLYFAANREIFAKEHGLLWLTRNPSRTSS